jgi:hypothetical protein
MARLLRTAFVVFFFGMAASSASAAAGVRLSFSDGRVWLTAQGANAGQILAEWARVGGTRVVNGDRVAGQPLTLEMSGVPEMEALEIVLRSAAGFIAAARAPELAVASPHLSRLDQITVLAVGARPPADFPDPAPTQLPAPIAPPVSMPIFSASGARRIVGADGRPIPDDQEGAPPQAGP